MTVRRWSTWAGACVLALGGMRNFTPGPTVKVTFAGTIKSFVTV